MMEKSKAGLFATIAIGLAVIYAMVDNEPAQATEVASIGYYFAEQQANLSELHQVKAQLIELGEEGSDLYFAVLNAIDTSQQLVNEATYWQSGDKPFAEIQEQRAL